MDKLSGRPTLLNLTWLNEIHLKVLEYFNIDELPIINLTFIKFVFWTCFPKVDVQYLDGNNSGVGVPDGR